MAVVSAASFARRFRALSDRERREFVAALWTVRGYDTRLEDGVVLAHGDDHLRIGVVDPWAERAWWIARHPGVRAVSRRLGIGHVSGSRDVDLLIATRDSDWARDYARGRDATFVSPTDLYEMLVYGVERGAAQRLVTAHLDATLHPEQAERTGGSSPDRGRQFAEYTGVQPGIVGIVVIVVVAVLAFVFVGVPGMGAPPVDDSTADVAPVPAEGPDPSALGLSDDDSPPADSSDGLPPGLSPDGVENASQLLEAHRDRTAHKPRVVHLQYEGPTNTTMFSDVTRHESTLRVHSETNYLLSIDKTVSAGNDTQDVRLAEYRNGTQTHLRFQRGDDAQYSVTRHADTDPTPPKRTPALRIYEHAMSADETDLDTHHLRNPSGMLRRTHPSLYRVTATSTPPELADEASDFRAIAHLTHEGRLVELFVTYTHRETGEPVSFTVVYAEADPDQSLEPSWCGTQSCAS